MGCGTSRTARKVEEEILTSVDAEKSLVSSPVDVAVTRSSSPSLSCSNALEGSASDADVARLATPTEGERGRLERSAVSLEFLESFVQDIPPTLTTQEVVETIIKPRTAERKCSFVELSPPEKLSSPTIYVSHTWSGPFVEMIDSTVKYVSLAQAGSPRKQAFVWLDVFAVNQHCCEQEAELRHMERAIATADVTLLCLDPQGFTLGRTWNLLEVYKTLTMRDADSLRVILRKPASAELQYSITNIDVSSSAAPDNDRAGLMNHIENAVGFQMFNEIVAKGLLDGAQSTAGFLLSITEGDLEATANLCSNHAELLVACHLFQEAEALWKRCIQLRTVGRVYSHVETATVLNNLAFVLMMQQRVAEAEAPCSEALKLREALLGSQHSDTASSMNALAGLLQLQGRIEEAEPLYRKAVVVRSEVHGPEHPATASSLYELAELCSSQGKATEAEKLMRQSLHARTSSFGALHPITKTTSDALAALLASQGKGVEDPLTRAPLKAGVVLPPLPQMTVATSG